MIQERNVKYEMNDSIFEKKTGHRFGDKTLLKRALTHSSYCRENGIPSYESNERLEFLGDAFLDAIVGNELYRRMPRVNEGRLTKTRAVVVCEKSLSEIGNEMNIGEFLYLGNGEAQTGGRGRDSIIADAIEAVIGAIFLDAGYEPAERFVLSFFDRIIRDAIDGRIFSDYKTEVQELLQKGGRKPYISYVLDRTEGPDHDKTFFVHLVCNNVRMGSGTGKTKKEAEQEAAKASLEGGYLDNVL